MRRHVSITALFLCLSERRVRSAGSDRFVVLISAVQRAPPSRPWNRGSSAALVRDATVSGIRGWYDHRRAIWGSLALSGCAFIPQLWCLQLLEGDMHRLRFLLPLISALLIATSGLTQPNQPTAPSRQTGAGEWITQLQPDQWQASNLDGLDVYSSNNGDKIGDISELIFDNSGKVQAVVIGVGGYLGIGERAIAVPFDQIRFVNEPRLITTGTTTGEARLAGASPGGGTVASPSAAGTAAVPAGSNNPSPTSPAANNAPAPVTPETQRVGQSRPSGSGSSPNHAILLMSITKDELQAAAEFRATR
jgi:sporulation protein YlmC with PRC-barrel domain